MFCRRGRKGTALPLVVAVALAVATAGAAGLRDARAGAVLDSATVARTVRDYAPSVRGCYDAAIGKKHAPTGKLLIAWTINAAGKVESVRIEKDEIRDARLASCLRNTIEGWRFTPPAEPTDVSFPFVFETMVADGSVESAVPTGGPPTPSQIAAWETAREWLAALERLDAPTIGRLTALPFAYRPIGLKKQCEFDSSNPRSLKKWVSCLGKAKSQLVTELGTGSEPRVSYGLRPAAKLEAASRGLNGGEWVHAVLNGEGVTFTFRFLVSTGVGNLPLVKALVVSAYFDEV
jgi:hypothetical protein